MIREVITPQSTDFYLKIPQEYLNRPVEFLMFALDEQSVMPTSSSDIASLAGSLNRYADPTKIALEDGAWEAHVIEKYRLR
ncbi:MAG: hypothetical protein KU37_10910 [Sulfuricurvum sp. PC08-66]|nr:MAG: hypothetical protein KU37_10910 [Sulfuricurvum sp. PC08-66]